MRPLHAIGGLLALHLAASPATAQDTSGIAFRLPDSAAVHGTRLRVLDRAGVRTTGWLDSLGDRRLVLRHDYWTPFPGWNLILPSLIVRRVGFEPDTVRRIDLAVGRERRTRATIAGTLAGAAVGGIVGASRVRTSCSEPSLGPCFDRADGTLMGVVIGATAGFAIGRWVFGRERWMEVWPAVPAAPPAPAPPAG